VMYLDTYCANPLDGVRWYDTGAKQTKSHDHAQQQYM
jgi:hypothetical protein